MFSKGFQWIDDIRDKFESMCADVDEVVSSETSKYIEDLQTVGTNVKQICSTADPLKYVEDQLQTVGTKVEELYSSVVPSSVDTMLSTINGIFPAQGTGSMTREEEKTEVKDCEEDLDDSKPEPPVTPTETADQIVSDLKSDSSSLDLGDNDSIIYEEGKDFVVPDEPAHVDFDEKTSSSYAAESVTDEGIDTGFSSSGPEFDSSSSELEEITEADDKISQNAENAELSESYVVGNMSDGLPQESYDESSKKQSLRNAIRKRLHKIRSKRDDARSRLEMEPAKSLPDSWESEWEII